MKQIYIIIAIAVLAVIASLMFFMKGKKSGSKLSPLAGLAFAFVLAGIIFGENRLVGYGLMGIGVLIALVDMIKKLKKKS
ncbi:MAG: hypothetical protein WCW00_01300 [Candidatus Paceibacterota bacterium]